VDKCTAVRREGSDKAVKHRHFRSGNQSRQCFTEFGRVAAVGRLSQLIFADLFVLADLHRPSTARTRPSGAGFYHRAGAVRGAPRFPVPTSLCLLAAPSRRIVRAKTIRPIVEPKTAAPSSIKMVLIIGVCHAAVLCRCRRFSALRPGRLALRRTSFGYRNFEPSFRVHHTRPGRSAADIHLTSFKRNLTG
jgi:hypothetical protein